MLKNHEPLDGKSPIRMGAVLILVAAFVPAIMAFAVVQNKTENIERRLDRNEDIAKDLSKVKEDVSEIKGILSEMQRNR